MAGMAIDNPVRQRAQEKMEIRNEQSFRKHTSDALEGLISWHECVHRLRRDYKHNFLSCWRGHE